jgi:hypothetical protein
MNYFEQQIDDGYQPKDGLEEWRRRRERFAREQAAKGEARRRAERERRGEIHPLADTAMVHNLVREGWLTRSNYQDPNAINAALWRRQQVAGLLSLPSDPRVIRKTYIQNR